MGATRTPAGGFDARRRRLEALLESGRTGRVTKALHDLHDLRKPASILVRSPLIRSDLATGPGEDDAPPASKMLSPRGQALRLYLLALFELQCTHGAGVVPKGERPLRRQPESEVPGWTDLFAAPVYGPPPGRRPKEPRTPSTNVARQLQSGMAVLEKLGLAELGADRSWRRFDGFRIMTESGRGALADPAYYRVPRAGTAGFRIPADFFLNGWLWALTNSEIAAYLMFRLLAGSFPGEHASGGVYIYGDDREQHFGLRRDAYESHITLSRFGLIERQFSFVRDSDGRVGGYKAGVTYEPHRFKLSDAGLDDDGVLHVLAQLEA